MMRYMEKDQINSRGSSCKSKQKEPQGLAVKITHHKDERNTFIESLNSSRTTTQDVVESVGEDKANQIQETLEKTSQVF